MGNAWALLTSDGIILFDTLGSGEEAQKYIVDGLTSLGLDPMTIKRIVVMHGHADHYGGAAYLRAMTGAPVYMSAIDWNFVAAEATKGPQEAERLRRIPTRDRILADGEALTLGDTSVRFFLTPGHTPGTLSAILPVVDHGERHVAAYWGGAAIPPALMGAQAYVASVDRFAPAAGKAEVDAFISNHPTNDLTLLRLPALAARKPGAAHPFVVGRRGSARMFDILRECARAAQADAVERKP
jgi:metallo-beta-lactamase class B